jgi:hypothetical protein
MTQTQRKYPKGTEEGLLEPFADKPPMYSRVGYFSSFDGTNSYNLVWGGTSSANTDYEDNHILIHSIRMVNTDDGDDEQTTIYLYQNDDATSANARSGKNNLCYFTVAGAHSDLVSSVVTIEFPIPLLVKNGCRITCSRNGPIANVCYTILNTSDSTDWYNDLQYRYLSAASRSNSIANQTVHPNWGPMLTVDTLSTADDHDTGTYTDVALTGGTGFGAKATVVVDDSGDADEGAVSSVTITSKGEGYSNNDSLLIDNATIGGASDATCLVATFEAMTTDVQLWGGYSFNSSGTNDDYSTAFVRNGATHLRVALSLQMNQHASTDQSAANTNSDGGVVWYPYPVHLKNGMGMDNDDTDIYATWFYRPVKQAGVTYDQYGD